MSRHHHQVLTLIAALLLIGSASAGVLNSRYQQYQLQQQQQQQGPAPPAQFDPATSGGPRNLMRHNYYQTDSAAAASNTRQQSVAQPAPPGSHSSLGNGDLPPMLRPGISAWGLISLIVFVILCGMAIYYAVMCYPIFCGKDVEASASGGGSMYNTMREASSTSTSGTPLGNYENEKMGNYSSRSTTPTKSREAFEREARMDD